MYTRLNDVPIFEVRHRKMRALYFNHVQQALKYLGDSVRFQIPKLRTLELILQKDAWIIVDRQLNDYPIAAWTAFEVQSRDNLHEDIPCRLQIYHMYAGMVLNRTLEAMELILGEQMQEKLRDTNGNKVLEFPSVPEAAQGSGK